VPFRFTVGGVNGGDASTAGRELHPESLSGVARTNAAARIARSFVEVVVGRSFGLRDLNRCDAKTRWQVGSRPLLAELDRR
jgi:hypothetical protein